MDARGTVTGGLHLIDPHDIDIGGPQTLSILKFKVGKVAICVPILRPLHARKRNRETLCGHSTRSGEVSVSGAEIKAVP